MTALGQWKRVYQKDWMIYHCLVNTVDGSCLNDFFLNGWDVDMIVKENWGEFYQKPGTWTQLDLKTYFFSTAKMAIFPTAMLVEAGGHQRRFLDIAPSLPSTESSFYEGKASQNDLSLLMFIRKSTVSLPVSD